jgi:hypothetical protein
MTGRDIIQEAGGFDVRAMRELRSLDHLYRRLVVYWEWPTTTIYDRCRKALRPVGVVITRDDNPFGLFHCDYLVQCLDDWQYCFCPKAVFEQGGCLYAPSKEPGEDASDG